MSVAIVCMVNHTALKEQGLDNSSDVMAPECGRNITQQQEVASSNLAFICC